MSFLAGVSVFDRRKCSHRFSSPVFFIEAKPNPVLDQLPCGWQHQCWVWPGRKEVLADQDAIMNASPTRQLVWI
jgi:hypothetical protein